MSNTKDGNRTATSNPLIAEPCPTLERVPSFGDRDTVKVCEGCNERVHNLSALTADEAVALVETSEGICVRFDAGVRGQPRFRPRLMSGLTMALSLAAGCGSGPDSNETTTPIEATETTPKDQPGFVGRVARTDKKPSNADATAEPANADCEDDAESQ